MTTTVKKTRSVKRAGRSKRSAILVRMDEKTKGRAIKLFKKVGLSANDGMLHLLGLALEDGYLPHVPNAETRKALEEDWADDEKPMTVDELWNSLDDVDLDDLK